MDAIDSSSSHPEHYVVPIPGYATNRSQPSPRQPLGPARLIPAPTPTRASSFPSRISTSMSMSKFPIHRHDSSSTEKMTPSLRHAYGKSTYTPSPTFTVMTTPNTPSTASSGTSPIQLGGIQTPAPFIGPYPVGYLRKEPVPSDDNDVGDHDATDLRRSTRQGAASCNPWDYVSMDQESVKDGEESKGKARRRFTKRELEALEVLWSISKSPTKYQRQRLGAWLGV